MFIEKKKEQNSQRDIYFIVVINNICTMSIIKL